MTKIHVDKLKMMHIWRTSVIWHSSFTKESDFGFAIFSGARAVCISPYQKDWGDKNLQFPLGLQHSSRKHSENIWLSCSSLACGGCIQVFKKADVLTSADPYFSMQVRTCCDHLPTPYLRSTTLERTPQLLLSWFPSAALSARRSCLWRSVWRYIAECCMELGRMYSAVWL